MNKERPVELCLAQQLRSDREFRKEFFYVQLKRTIAEQLRKRRAYFGYTQQDVADWCGVHVTLIENIEKADNVYQVSTYMSIADALDMTVSVTFEYFEDVIDRYE